MNADEAVRRQIWQKICDLGERQNSDKNLTIFNKSIELHIFVRLENHCIQISILGTVKKMPILHTYHHLTLMVFFSCPGAIITLFLSIITGTCETRVVSFDAVMCIFKESSVNVNGGSF